MIAQEISKKDIIQRNQKKGRWLSLSTLLAMIGAFLLFGALLPIRGLQFSNALIQQWGGWTYALTSFLFPDWELQPGFRGPHIGTKVLIQQQWEAFLLFTVVCIILFSLYILATYRLPAIVTRRYIICSTLLIGLIGILIPMLTSQDIISYIVYARMEAVYHVNPLTATPNALRHDILYSYIYWKNQPSVYGPTWIIITGGLQWLFNPLGLGSPPVMVIALRTLALGAHMGSSLLIWSISGYLQLGADKQDQRRKRAMLAFAWNPLLLVEASINAHNDTFVLFFILLACWLLMRPSSSATRSQIYATIMFALATAIKINVVLLMPGFFLYLWTQRQWLRSIIVTSALYGGIVLALYAPFWQNGTALKVFSVNPGANLSVNSLAEFSSDFLDGVIHFLTGSITNTTGPVIHTASMIIFVFVYGLLCLRTMQRPYRLYTPLHFLRFSALIWFLYCAIGAPWSWPWYTITFFGLFALLEATQEFSWQARTFLGTLTLPQATRLFTIGVFSIYIFGAKSLDTPISGFSPMRWAYLRGLAIWIIPVYVFSVYAWSTRHQWMRLPTFRRLI